MTTLPVVPRMAVPRSRPKVVKPLQLCPCQMMVLFPGDKTIIWQGQSCNGLTTFGRERGTAILGTTGSVVMDRDGYVVSDLHNKVVKQSLASRHADGLNLSADDDMTALHIANFVDAKLAMCSAVMTSSALRLR